MSLSPFSQESGCVPKRAPNPVGFLLHRTGLSCGYPAARASGRTSISRGHFAVQDEKGLSSKEKDAFRVGNPLDPSVAEFGGSVGWNSLLCCLLYARTLQLPYFYKCGNNPVTPTARRL